MSAIYLLYPTFYIHNLLYTNINIVTNTNFFLILVYELYIFALISVSIIAGILNNTLDKVVNAMLTSCNTAVHIALSLIGIMAFWLGIMRIAEKSGLVQIISKILYPVTKFLFKDVKKIVLLLVTLQ